MNLNLKRSSWKRFKFGDLVANINDYYRPESDGNLPYVAGPHIDAGSPTVSAYGSTDDPKFPPTFKRKFQRGDVLLHSRGIEKLANVDRLGVTGEKLFVLRSIDDNFLSQSFLLWLLMSPSAKQHMADNFTGSVNKFLNWGPLASFEFDLPPIDEQKRIADLLWAIERERRVASDLLATNRQVRALVRSELFDAISAPTHRFESICSIPSQNGVALKKSDRSGNTPMVNMGEMFKSEVISTTSDYERVVTPPSNFILAPGDLLFARRSIVFEGAGACCLVPDLDEGFTFESSVIRSRVEGDIDPRFVLHYFRSERGRRVMSQIVRRGPVSGISGSDLRTIPVPIPTLSVQSAIIRQIELVSSVDPGVERRRESAEMLGRAVLTEIFGGN